jgi:hypothetical protein
MNTEQQGIFAQPKKPGPITRAAMSIAEPTIAQQATDPDTDGRRQYSPKYGDSFANRGGYPANAPSGPSNGPDSTALTAAASGILAPPVAAQQVAEAIAPPAEAPAAAAPIVAQATQSTPTQGIAAISSGRDAQGVVTAESAQAAMGADMQRSGGIVGGIDLAAANAVDQRANNVRQQMIDAQVGGGTGKPVSWQDQHGNADPEKQRIAESNALLNKWDKQYQNGQAIAEMGRNPRAAQGIAHVVAGSNHDEAIIRGQTLNHEETMSRQGITARDQDMKNERAAAHNQVAMRGQDLRSDTASGRMTTDKEIAQARIEERQYTGERLTLPQRRSNFEIESARKAVEDLTPDEIKKRTQQFSATGRENKDFDPALAKAVSLAGRRMYGNDEHFDQRQQPAVQQPAGTDHDYVTRFKADKDMQGHKIGKQTDLGYEVLDSSGKVVGHYR